MRPGDVKTNEKGVRIKVGYGSAADLPDIDYRKRPNVRTPLPEHLKAAAEQRFKLIQRKGVFPFEWFQNENQLNDTELPGIRQFDSKLTGDICSTEDYEHAHNVWGTFGCNTMRDYMNLYVMTDVTLLADVMTTHRTMCKEKYHLDPLHSYTLPGYAWQSMLKMTGIELELITDANMYAFFENSVRGGISVISHRLGQANYKQMDADGYYGYPYDPNQPNRRLMYLDANNQYGWAMSEYLPQKGFRWMDEEELADVFDRVRNKDKHIRPDAPVGYTLEVSGHFPPETHDELDEYPPMPERYCATEDMLSGVQKAMRGESAFTANEKLIPNLYPKERYVLHYRNLQYYIEKGFELTEIHRGVRFEQSAWMEPFIQFNTVQRTMALLDFEKDIYKLMNNSVFGE